jgi:hydroxylamine reductase (hybrid-cluster protein)
MAELEESSHTVSIPAPQAQMGHDNCFSLTEISNYGSKGACAYAAHCLQLGRMDKDVIRGIHGVFRKLASDEADMEGLLANAVKVGTINGQVLAIFHTLLTRFKRGFPVRPCVPIGDISLMEICIAIL